MELKVRIVSACPRGTPQSRSQTKKSSLGHITDRRVRGKGCISPSASTFKGEEEEEEEPAVKAEKEPAPAESGQMIWRTGGLTPD